MYSDAFPGEMHDWVYSESRGDLATVRSESRRERRRGRASAPGSSFRGRPFHGAARKNDTSPANRFPDEAARLRSMANDAGPRGFGVGETEAFD